MKGHTTLVIAHRLSTIENGLPDSGNGSRVVERSRHADLLLLNGYYARLHAKQFKGDEVESQEV